MSEAEVLSSANTIIDNFQSSTFGPWGLTILKVGIVVIPLILFTIAYILIRRKYTIDEVKYQRMLKDISEGRIVKDE